MICTIYCKYYYIPFNVHKNIIDTKKNEIKHYNLNDSIDRIEHKISRGHGFFMKIVDEIYVISCYHIVKNDINIFTMINIEHDIVTISLKIKKIVKELDIVILSIDTKYIKYIDSYYNEYDVCNDLQYIFSEHDKLLHINEYKKEVSECKNIEQIIFVDNVEINNMNVNTTLIPKIPCINMIIKNINFEVSGISGSILTINNKLVSITSSINNNIFQGIPISIIIDIFKNNIEMTGILFSSVPLEFNDDSVVKYGHYITKTICNEITYKTTTGEKFKFREGDIIYKINDKEITKNCKIFDEKINYEVLVNTYIMFNSKVSISLYRNINNEMVIITKELVCESFDNYYNIHYYNTYDYLFLNGYTFMELSEEYLINLGKIKSFNLEKLFKYFRKINNLNKKYIVVIDINISNINKRDIKKIIDIDIFNKKKILILNKVNNIQISYLSDITKYYSDNTNVSFDIYNDNSNDILNINICI